jgi:hypothetical protein
MHRHFCSFKLRAWVRSDYTGFEVMLGDMTTFVSPEQTAKWARLFFSK